MKLLSSIVTAALLTAAGSTASFAAKVPTPDAPPAGVKIATADDIKQMVDAKEGTIFDVRWHYSEYYFEGHIPGAVSVPFTEWSKKKEGGFNIAEDTWNWDALPADKNEKIAFYCMGLNCWKSYKIADEAAKRGYTNVLWYKGGQPEWDALGMPSDSVNVTYKPLQTLFKGKEQPVSWLAEPEDVAQWIASGKKIQVIDLRYWAFFEEGRIDGALQVETKDLLSRDGIQLMPNPQLEKGGLTKIVLVSENGQLAMAGAVSLKLLGYDVAVLNGGMAAWKTKMGDKHIVSGKLAQNWPGKTGWKGQVFKLPKNEAK